MCSERSYSVGAGSDREVRLSCCVQRTSRAHLAVALHHGSSCAQEGKTVYVDDEACCLHPCLG